MKGGWVYIMSDKPHGTSYVGVTSEIARRVWEHREGVVPGLPSGTGLNALSTLNTTS